MTTPVAPIGPPGVAATVLALFEQLHHHLRREVGDLDDAALNWAPAPGANTIATIVTHIVGSEAETWRCVAGVPSVRDRPEEFVPETRTAEQLLAALHGSDALLAELRAEMTADRLSALVALPTLRADDRRSGLAWLVGNYGHAREHLGHVQLTKQLYRARQSGTE